MIEQLFCNEKLHKKNLLLLPNKLIQNVAYPRNAKEHFDSFLRKKNRK